MNNVQTAWVAGLAEGEFWFTIGKYTDSRDGKQVRVGGKMTDLDVLEDVLSITKVGNITGPSKKKETHHKDCWQYMISHRYDIQIFCARILPYMKERRSKRIKEIQHRFLELLGVPKCQE